MPRDSDPWPDEPDETDPEERWGDPERDLVNVPSVGGEDDDEGPIEIDGELAKTFWAVVILANVGVAGVCIGAMVVFFRGEYLLGGGAVAVGVLALVRGYYTYRDYRDRDDGSDSADPDD